ncbi:MAG: phytanoyl-CoA dioxygenase family protein [Pseudomonadota bacterium]
MIAFGHFHAETLPAALASGRDALLRGLSLPSLTIRVGDDSVTYVLSSTGFEIRPGQAEADISVTLSEDDWSGLVGDVETVPGILYGDRLLDHSGNVMDFVRWDPILRALYTGRPLYDPQAHQLVDRRGGALDPLLSFTLDNDAAAMREFLDAAGYLLVKSVFSVAELTEFRSAARDLAVQARQGDQRSWWGKDQDGHAVLSRCLNAGEQRAFRGLYDDPRIAQLAALLPDGMRHPAAEEQDGVTVVFKQPGVAEGLSDLPWHRDCGMGGHANMCPCYVLSIYLHDATEAQGPLQFLPGSQDYALGFADARDVDYACAVTVPARAGDVTLHIGDVMHAAPPPEAGQQDYRQSVLLSYHPDFENHRGERHYNDALLGDEQGQVRNLKTFA